MKWVPSLGISHSVQALTGEQLKPADVDLDIEKEKPEDYTVIYAIRVPGHQCNVAKLQFEIFIIDKHPGLTQLIKKY